MPMARQHGLFVAAGSFAGAVFRGSRDNRWARWALNSVVFAAVGIALAGRAQNSQQPAAPPPASPALVQPQAGINAIVAVNLFGVYGNSEEKPGMLARSSLNVVVTGLLVLGTAGSLATISVDEKPETSFAIGEEILPGVRLHAVESERVVLSRNGLLEAVPIRELASFGKVSPPMASVASVAAMPAPISPRGGQRDWAPLATNTATPDNQTAAPQGAATVGPPGMRRNGRNGGARREAAEPQPGADTR